MSDFAFIFGFLVLILFSIAFLVLYVGSKFDLVAKTLIRTEAQLRTPYYIEEQFFQVVRDYAKLVELAKQYEQIVKDLVEHEVLMINIDGECPMYTHEDAEFSWPVPGEVIEAFPYSLVLLDHLIEQRNDAIERVDDEHFAKRPTELFFNDK